MIIAKTRNELSELVKQFHLAGLSTGLVPTMGALHAGHRSLLERSVRENDQTICSIFVNPTQFTERSDLERYPRPIEDDIALLEEVQANVLFIPAESEIYPQHEIWHLDLDGLDNLLEGKSRPGHFQGVTQIVSKLFMLVQPCTAYFGQKDFQQFAVISKMLALSRYSVSLVSCPIVREDDGLAMSSRNVHLNQAERLDAGLISKALFLAEELFSSGNFSPERVINQAIEVIKAGSTLTLDYLTIVDPHSLRPINEWPRTNNCVVLVAVWAGKTRLIDNLVLVP